MDDGSKRWRNQKVPHVSPTFQTPFDRVQSRHDCIMIESQMRQIHQKMILEEELARNRKMLVKLEEELKEREEQLNGRQPENAEGRVQEQEKKRKWKEEMKRKSNITMLKLEQLQHQKLANLQKALKTNRASNHQLQLLRNNKRDIPINFSPHHTHIPKQTALNNVQT
jgi:hypothetical protein